MSIFISCVYSEYFVICYMFFYLWFIILFEVYSFLMFTLVLPLETILQRSVKYLFKQYHMKSLYFSIVNYYYLCNWNQTCFLMYLLFVYFGIRCVCYFFTEMCYPCIKILFLQVILLVHLAPVKGKKLGRISDLLSCRPL